MNYFFEEPPEPQIDIREKQFHNLVREYVIFLLILMSLYGISYILIYLFCEKKEEIYINDEDALVYRISFWMCTFSLGICIGSAFLLPFSIVTNELLLFYPQNYYMQWLNDSLIYGLWNYVFLFSNISLFVLLPFAYFFTESEGFTGSNRGIMSRVNETIMLLLLLMVLILGITYILCCTLGYSELALTNLFTIWHYLPLLYSYISCFGVILLLLCTPIGFATLFTVLGDLIIKPKFLRDIQQEYEVAMLEEMSSRRELERLKQELTSFNQQTLNNETSFFEYYRSKSLPSFTELLSETSFNLSSFKFYNSIFDKSFVFDEFKEPSFDETLNNCSISQINSIRKRNLANSNDLNKKKDILFKQEQLLIETEKKRKHLQTLKRASALRRNFGYPIAILLLLCLTISAIALVLKNILELLVGIKALPITSTQRFTIGISSLYKSGYFGAFLEILLIFYLWNTSIVGLYTLPFLNRLKPKIYNTSFTKIIINCALLLILSSALPVLARTIGITNFDLLGNFGRIEWLGNFYIVLFYNLVFAFATTLTLAKKFTGLMYKELFKRLKNIWSSPLASCGHLNASKNTSKNTTNVSLS